MALIAGLKTMILLSNIKYYYNYNLTMIQVYIMRYQGYYYSFIFQTVAQLMDFAFNSLPV